MPDGDDAVDQEEILQASSKQMARIPETHTPLLKSQALNS